MSPASLAGPRWQAAQPPSSKVLPSFEKRTAPAPELEGISERIGKLNEDPRLPKQVLEDLRAARSHFADLMGKGEQTAYKDGPRTQELIKPILNAENARSPGLNAVEFDSREKMVEFLRPFASPNGQEGHIRCHCNFGYGRDSHRVAIDAFKHKEGGFTLIAVDSLHRSGSDGQVVESLGMAHGDLIKGTLLIPTPNLLHNEGCRIFAVHNLNAMHDYQPEMLKLHRQVYDKAQGRPAPLLSPPKWGKMEGNTFVLNRDVDSFSVLPGKFFKHIQVKKPWSGSPTMLDEAEMKYPELKEQPVNKKGQTLRQRVASQNPDMSIEEFSRADRTASLDKKRLDLIDRAIAHYGKLYGADGKAAT